MRELRWLIANIANIANIAKISNSLGTASGQPAEAIRQSTAHR